jgi:hypothetical protein
MREEHRCNRAHLYYPANAYLIRVRQSWRRSAKVGAGVSQSEVLTPLW